MHFIQYQQGGTLETDLNEFPTSGSVHVSIYNPNGSLIVASASIAMDGIDTGITAAVTASAQSISVANASGIVAGRRYLFDGSEDAQGETVTVRSVSGSTITFARPVLYAHSSGSTFQSTRVVATVPASAATPIARHYRAHFAYQVSGVQQPDKIISFDVVRFVPASELTLEDIRDLEPNLKRKLPDGATLKSIKDRTWKTILDYIANTIDPGAFVSTPNLTVPHTYLIMSELLLNAGPDYVAAQEKYATLYAQYLETALGASTVDINQDGQISTFDFYRSTIKLIRS
jgi:hypothetical protein